MKLSNHFDSSEFECSCGCGEAAMESKTIEMLENIREHFGENPVYVHSGFRCVRKQKNLIKQGLTTTLKSTHCKGLAVDLHIKNIDIEDLHWGCIELQKQGVIDGLGIYSWGVHVDKRGYKAQWNNL